MADVPVDEAFVRSANALQLHAEARGSLPPEEWPASFTVVDGRWVYRVQRPDVDVAALSAVVAAHRPDPTYGRDPDRATLAALDAKSSLTAQEVAAAVKILVKRAL